jgi:parallel beta-helix repeat protein
MKTNLCSGALWCAFFFVVCNPIEAQGPLTPPGPPTPTMKTLDQVEPRIDVLKLSGDGANKYVISQSGSYYLSGNITGDAFRGGIFVNASGVTIDLNGFTISGVPNAASGIFLGSGVSRIAIVNGTIANWPTDGINGGLSLAARFEKLTLTGNGNSPIQAGLRTGQAAVVRDCVAMSNTGHGFRSGDAVVFNSCSAYFNTGSGFALSNNDTVTDCVAQGNGNHGFEGTNILVFTGCVSTGNANAGFTSTGGGCLLDRCSAASNAGNGIAAGVGSTVVNCSASNNQGTAGISAGAGSTLENCTASNNQGTNGISVGSDCTLTHCTARANTSASSASSGISAGVGCTITACTVADNTNTSGSSNAQAGTGISVARESKVQDCVLFLNQGDGIRATAGPSTIIGNVSTGNGQNGDGAGVRVDGNGSRVEGNHVSSNDRGIDVSGGSNLIIKNSASNNTTNYNIAVNNRYGPIVDLTALGSAAVTGNSAAGTTVNADPEANFAY